MEIFGLPLDGEVLLQLHGKIQLSKGEGNRTPIPKRLTKKLRTENPANQKRASSRVLQPDISSGDHR